MKRLEWLLLFTLILVLPACATHKVGHVELRDCEQYANFQEMNGIEVAADLFADEMKTKEAFYINVNEESYYPINLIVENRTNGKLLIMKNHLQVLDSSGRVYKPISSAVMIDEFERNKMAYALLGFGIFSYMSAEDANEKMATDWRDKELPKQLILASNRMESGFVYMKLPKGIKPNNMKLLVDIEEVELGKVNTFEIIL